MSCEPWIHRDGSLILLNWKNTVLKDEAGGVQYVIGTGIDITEQRNAENQARQHLEEVSRLQRLQTANELATMLAHELNQPLAAIAAMPSRTATTRPPPRNWTSWRGIWSGSASNPCAPGKPSGICVRSWDGARSIRFRSI
jgi:hypothetical protein